MSADALYFYVIAIIFAQFIYSL